MTRKKKVRLSGALSGDLGVEAELPGAERSGKVEP